MVVNMIAIPKMAAPSQIFVYVLRQGCKKHKRHLSLDSKLIKTSFQLEDNNLDLYQRDLSILKMANMSSCGVKLGPTLYLEKYWLSSIFLARLCSL